MRKIYPLLTNRTDSLKLQFNILGLLKFRRSNALFFALSIILAFSSGNLSAQTVLIDPVAEGGFETGNTFASNGWSVANSANNPWVVGTAVSTAPFSGNSAYISNNAGVANAYTPDNQSSNFFWRNVTVPAGETKITLTFKWSCQGEATWDNWQVFYAPTSVNPVSSTVHPGNGTNNVPAGIAGATFIGFGQTTAGIQTATYSLPASLAGTTFRLIFSWKNETGGTQPPAAIDGISLTSQLPGNYTSIASGNWSAPTTWDSGSVPASLDNATISAGTTVTIDAAGQTANNLTVNGILGYGTTPTSFAVLGNMTVNAAGTFNASNGTTGKTLNVAGNLINNGTVNLSVGTGAAGNLTMNGTTVQTVSGAGIFTGNVIRNLVFSNTSTAIPNINWSVNNISVDNTLNISNAKVNLGANTLVSGTSITSTGTFTFANGGFMPGGKFSRWWTAGATGYTTANPSTIPTGQAGRYPFYSANGVERIFYLGRTGPTAGGQYAVTYADATTTTTGLAIVDGTYTITDRWDGHFDVSTEGTSAAAPSYFTTIFAPNVFYPLNGVGRVLGQSAALSGTHSNTTAGSAAQRTGVSFADLTGGLYIGYNTSDLLFASIASGDWNNPAIWNKGLVPSCTDAVTIAVGTTVTVTTAVNEAKNITINTGGTLIVSSGNLTVGCTLKNNFIVNNGTLTVSGGTLDVNGNINNASAASVFNQSGGNINIDGNDAGIIANSVASGTPLFNSLSNAVNLSAGTLLFVDPHAATTNTNGYTLYFNNSTITTATLATSANHTLQFGDGISTNAGGHADGFNFNNWVGSAYLSFGKVIVNGATGTNRKVTSVNPFTTTGNLEVNASSNLTAPSVLIGGNLTVNAGGEFVNTNTTLATRVIGNASTTLSYAPVTTAQTFVNNGIISNLAASPTANFASLGVNNTSASGLTLSSPFSVSGTLNLAEGKINTTETNVLSVGTATASGTITGGSVTAYINGPLKRTIASGNANTNFAFYPVGKTVYAPVWVAPTTTTAAVIKAASFDLNSGTQDASLTGLSATARWEVPVVSGTITNMNVRVGSASIISTSIPVQAPSAAGVYTNAFGSFGTFVAGTGALPNTTQSITPVALSGYTGYLSFATSNVCSGIPVPGNTLSTASQICGGTSVTFSLQNSTAGTGVTYVWESSTDNVNYTPIAGATSSTYTVAPTTDSYYRAKVTCGGGTDTGTSTPFHITFNNSVATTPSSRCGVGTLDLTATANTGAIINWYDAASGGSLIGTGSPFTTPSISATTTYYAQSETTALSSATIGAGASTSTSAAMPFDGAYGSLKGQYIFTAAELQAMGLRAGDITSLSFDFTVAGGPYNNFALSLGNTSLNAFPAGGNIQGGLTQVYSAASFVPTVGLNSLVFSTPFNWNGTSNVIVSLCWHYSATATSGPAGTVKSDAVASGLNVSQSYRKDVEASPCAFTGTVGAGTNSFTISAVRPKMSFIGQVACISPRVAALATITSPPAFALSTTSTAFCQGASSTAVTVATGVSDYDTYNWLPATGVSGDHLTGWTFNPNVTTTYTLTASQTTGTLCNATATVAITVNPVPTELEVSNGDVCIGSVLRMPISGGTVAGSKVIGIATTLTGDQEQPTAFNNRWANYTSQTIYTKAELEAAGIVKGAITALSYNVTTLGDAATNPGFTVKIGTTTGANFANTTFLSTTAYTTVYGPSTYTHTASGWNTITFTTPFLWDGTSNIVIQTSMSGADVTNNSKTYFTATTDNKVLWANSLTATAGTLSLNRLNVRLNAQVSGIIAWSPMTDLYTDTAATVAYTGTEPVVEDKGLIVYVKPSAVGSTSYTVTSTNLTATCATGPATVVITGNALPILTVTNPAAVCTGSTANITAEAVTSGSDTGLTLSYWTNASATTAYATPATATAGTYYIKAVNTNGCSVISPVVVTVNTLPILTITNPAAVCTGSTVDITAAAVVAGSDTGLVYSYWADPFGTVTFPNPNAIPSSGTYYIKGTNANGCSVISPVVVTVNSAPALVITNPAAVCTGSTVDITAATVVAGSDTGLVYSYWADPFGTVTFPSPNAIPSSGTYYIKAVNANGCSVISPVVVTVNSAPALVITNPAAVCTGSTVDITAAAVVTGSDTGLVYSYWADPFGAVTFPSPNAIPSSGTYYIKAVNANGCSVISPVVVTVNSAPALVITNPAAVCTGSTVDITAAAVVAGSDAGLVYSYWADPFGAVTFPSPNAIPSSGTYYIKAVNANGCSVISPVVVTVNNTLAPTGTSPQDFTGGDTLADFTVNGDQIIWYDAPVNGNILPSNTLIVSGTIYYASQTVGGCESALRLAVTAGADLHAPGFDLARLTYYPNPVSDVLTIDYSDTIDAIEIYNLLGQKVAGKTYAANQVKVDMTNLASGTYLFKVVSKGIVKDIKIIKR